MKHSVAWASCDWHAVDDGIATVRHTEVVHVEGGVAVTRCKMHLSADGRHACRGIPTLQIHMPGLGRRFQGMSRHCRQGLHAQIQGTRLKSEEKQEKGGIAGHLENEMLISSVFTEYVLPHDTL